MDATLPTTKIPGNDFPWTVQKFGGLSIGQYLDQIPKVIQYHLDGSELGKHNVALICSARSSHPHTTSGTTSRLLQVVNSDEPSQIKSQQISQLVHEILEEYTVAAHSHAKEPVLLQGIIDAMRGECKKLQFLLEALEVVGEASDRSLDLVVKVGEKLSCHLVMGILEANNIKAKLVDLDRALDDESEEPIDFVKATAMVKACINTQTQGDSSRVLVIPGFIGRYPGGLLKTIGRGYSDVTAALVSWSLSSEELVVWKPADGIYTADPSKVQGALLLPKVTSAEAYELTYYGAEAVHPLAIEIMSKANIPLHLFNITKAPRPAVGTLVSQDPAAQVAGVLATAVTHKDKVTVINVHSNRKSRSHDFLRRVFAILAKYKLITDLISTSEVHLSIAISKVDKLDEAVKELKALGTVNVVPDQAIISLVGQRMTKQVGVARAFFSALSVAGANLEMISQGSSEINISVVTPASHALKALQFIHDKLLIPTPAP